MVNLSNGNDWVKIYDQHHTAQARPNQPNRFFPILPIVIPTNLDHRVVAVYSRPLNPKNTWSFGGRVYPLVNVSNEIIVGRYSRYYPIGINEVTMFRVDRISPYYRLVVVVPRWFPDVYLQVWTFTGIDTGDDSIEGRLTNIETELETIEIQLDRIESKINNQPANAPGSASSQFDDPNTSSHLGII